MGLINSTSRKIWNAVTLNWLRPRVVTGGSGDPGSPLYSVPLDSNSIVVACVRWIQRTISEAPPILQKWLPDKQEWEDVYSHRLLDLLVTPNHSYPGTSLWKATIRDLVLQGNAYWLLMRNALGAPVQIWWIPADRMTPVAMPGTTFGAVDYYRYTGTTPLEYQPDEIVHFRDGLSALDATMGHTDLGSIAREIAVDERAGLFTQTLMNNSGQPGAILGPQAGNIPQDTAKLISRKSGTRSSQAAMGPGRCWLRRRPWT